MLLSGAWAGTGAGSNLDRLHNTDNNLLVQIRVDCEQESWLGWGDCSWAATPAEGGAGLASLQGLCWAVSRLRFKIIRIRLQHLAYSDPDPSYTQKQCCGSKYIEFGSGSRSGSRVILVLYNQLWKKKFKMILEKNNFLWNKYIFLTIRTNYHLKNC